MSGMRLDLKMWRLKNGYRQEDVAKTMGMSRVTYQSIELGKRDGRQSFWERLQKAYDIPDAEMWLLMKKQ